MNTVSSQVGRNWRVRSAVALMAIATLSTQPAKAIERAVIGDESGGIDKHLATAVAPVVAPGSVLESQRPLFERLLRRADANGDGQLSRDELAAVERQELAAPHHEARRRVGGDGDFNPDAKPKAFAGAKPGKGKGASTPDRIEHRVMRLDANHDGKIERGEFAEQRMQHFDRFDTNHDGALDQAEIRSMAEKIAARAAKHAKRKRPADA